MKYLIFLVSLPIFAANFQLASQGCPMSHCNPQLTDAVNVVLPEKFGLVFHDNAAIKSGFGLGCSSNSIVVACSYTDTNPPYLKVYDSFGTVLWTSNILDNIAIFCDPMVGSDNGVIACDDVQMVRYDPNGNVLWDTCYYSGTAPVCTCIDGVTLPPCAIIDGQHVPSSPVQVANGSIVLATGNTTIPPIPLNPIFNINSDTGVLLSTTYLGQHGNISYSTTNTPCVSPIEDSGNRVFIITNDGNAAGRARMYALTINANSTSVAWVYPPSGDFTGPSQASPLCYNGGVFTDGIDSVNSQKGAVWGFNQHDGSVIFSCDSAGTGCPTTNSKINGGFALDPRGNSFWLFWGGGQTYQRRSSIDGSLVQTISMGPNYIAGEPCGVSPSAATMIANDLSGTANIITSLISSTSCAGGAYLAAIDTITGNVSNFYKIESNVNNSTPGYPIGQFTILGTTAKRIAFGVSQSAMYLVGDSLGGSSLNFGITIKQGVTIQ